MDFSSFLTSLGTSFVIFVVLMLLFVWLSRKPGNAVVYYPNRILKGLDPVENGYVSRNPFSWIREALSSSEADIITMSGVDTAVYFVFLTTALGILVFSGLILLPTLLPVAATDHSVRLNSTTSNGTFNELDRLSMGHIGKNSPRLWAFLIATYWVSVVTYFFLWKAYKHVSGLRVEALMSSEASAEQYAILVRDIPPVPEGQSRKEQVDSYFSKIYPETFYRSMLVTDNKKVNKIYEELVGYKKKLERTEAIYAKSKETKPEEPKPTHKTGFLGILGEKVDSIEFYNEKINDLTSKLEAEQKVTLKEKQQCCAIVFFNSRVTAASASQSLHSPMVDRWTVTDAPEPRQLIWTNLAMGFYQRIVRQYVIYFIVLLTIFFYMIPIGFISALTTLKNLRKYLPFLKVIVDQPAIKTVLEAYLPQLALIVFLALLPKFLLFLSKAEGIPSESHATRAASGKYFYFTVLNVFIGVTIGSTLFNTFKSIQAHPNSIISLLATSLPSSATFFLTFVALKFFVGYGLELSRIVPLIIFHLKKKYMCKTDAEIKEAWAPGDLGYATRFPGDMLILIICLCYSVIAPIIIPFGAVYFGLGWLLLRNQALKVYVPSFESYGKMWPHMHTRVVAALILYQLTMIGYFGVKKFPYAPLLIPLPILSFIFAFVCRKKFYRFFQSTALEVVSAGKEKKEVPNMEIIFRSFIPPCFGTEKSDEDHFEDALSQVSRSASNV
ncbi:CSC1-like protein ERD4 [Ipomoea triloba]|uniref:CSC1-like protein ERD4 n=1 Tax=Ipomoea triloba TaxID=35885 RepID=UPI00125D81FF|nr:CSC1-like protein ERD4 [Ipomoea triloba]